VPQRFTPPPPLRVACRNYDGGCTSAPSCSGPKTESCRRDVAPCGQQDVQVVGARQGDGTQPGPALHQSPEYQTQQGIDGTRGSRAGKRRVPAAICIHILARCYCPCRNAILRRKLSPNGLAPIAASGAGFAVSALSHLIRSPPERANETPTYRRRLSRGSDRITSFRLLMIPLLRPVGSWRHA